MTKTARRPRMPVRTKMCKYCRQDKPLCEFPPHEKTYLRQDVCATCQILKQQCLAADPKKKLWHTAYEEAKRRGMGFEVKMDDIPLPEDCVYLGITLDYTSRNAGKNRKPPEAATLSLINPDLGYLSGNVEVISRRAHDMKDRATLEQLVMFARRILATCDQES